MWNETRGRAERDTTVAPVGRSSLLTTQPPSSAVWLVSEEWADRSRTDSEGAQIVQSERRSVRGHRLVIVGLIVALVVSVSGVALAGTSAPKSLNTCTKVNKHGVYGKTKVVSGTSCSGTALFQTWAQPSKIPTSPGYVQGVNGDGWVVVIPPAQAQAPSGTMTIAGGPCASSASPSSSGFAVAGIPSGFTFYWGLDTGSAYSSAGSFDATCAGGTLTYSGDANYQGFSVSI